ncbi:MAG: S8 family serine peptidase [Acetobacteraceae bacterium]|nr:S8 family serine peptidase [Acetobacteraceae bacterium]
MKCVPAAAAMFLIALLIGPALSRNGPPPAPKEQLLAVPGQALVKFRPGATEAAIAEAHGLTGASELRRFQRIQGLVHVKLPDGKRMDDVLAAYRTHPSVEYATPDYLRKLAATPNDPFFTNGSLWGLQNPTTRGNDIHAPDAWNLTTGSHDVVVMVIDSGIDYTHEDLAPNMWRNTADCFNDGIDHDHNGWINDCFGINPSGGNANPMDDTATIGSHGTTVAGIIGAAGNNGIGIVGVNWQIGLMACKAFDSTGVGPDSAIITCLDYALMMKQRGVNIVATNNSGAGAPFDPALRDAIAEHMKAGILFIAAAGGGPDEDNPSESVFPANYDLPNIIAVAALEKDDQLSPGSGFGAHTVHIGAPGSGIWSTTSGNGFDISDGTSNATAFVTGVAALLKAHNPSLDWRAIKNLILAGGDDDPALRNALSDTITGKRLNAFGAMTCSNSPILRRFRPLGSGLTVLNIPVGTQIGLSVLNINCAAPAGSVSVLVQPGSVVIPLLDDGQGPDAAAGDGLYSGVWVPPGLGEFTLTFPGNDVWQARVMPAYVQSVVPFSWETIAGTNLNLSDDSFASIAPPFAITVGDRSFSSVNVDSNGKLNFGPLIESEPLNVSLPDPTEGPSFLVAPFWDDLLPVQNTPQNVFWAATGEAPNRKLVVEWRNVSRASGCQDLAAQIDFQAVFAEGSTDVQFNYAKTAFGGPPACAEGDNGAHATVGLQLVAPIAAQFSFDQPSLKDQMSIRFTQVKPPS